MTKHFICMSDYSREEIRELLELAGRIKAKPSEFKSALAGKTLAMVFQKSSTRTRVSFEVGMYELGGSALFLSAKDIQLGRGESVKDTALTLSCYVDGIMARTYGHKDVEDLAKYSRVPVINGLSDLLHPCQAMADFLTIKEHFKRLEGIKLCYIGDGNNVTHSLLIGAAMLDVNMAVATPKNYEPKAEIVKKARSLTERKILITNDVDEAVKDADVVYTDTWASMGQEEEHAKRLRDFKNYQVNASVMKKADAGAIFMHCLPAHRGEEVTDEVIDSAQSVVWAEAENRLHTQKAIMAKLLGGV